MIKGMDLRIIPIKCILMEDRAREKYGNIRELVESFKKEGMIQPIAVSLQEDGTYRLEAGGRRFMAAQQAGMLEVPCRVYTDKLTELEHKFIELSENIYRKDFEWHERCKLDKEIYTLMEKMHGRKISTSLGAPGISKQDVADMLGRSISGFAENIKMADVIEIMPELCALPTQDDARKLMKVVEKDMDRRKVAKQLLETQSTPIDQLHAQLTSCFIVKDFFEGTRDIPDNSVDVIELDPPYGIDLKGLKKMDAPREVLYGYNEIDAEEYIPFLTKTLKQCYRILKSGGWLLQWFGPDPWFEPVYSLLISTGFSLRRMPLIWHKSNSSGQTLQPEMYLGSTYEMCFYAKKDMAIIKKPGRANSFSYPTVPTNSKIHPAERPINMIQDLLETFAVPGPQTRVLVPFLGSGNTLLAAANLSMTAWGYELSQKYKDAYTIKVFSSKPGSYTSYSSGSVQNL